MDITDKHDYVHVPNPGKMPDPGKGVYIYVIDGGINLDVTNVSLRKTKIRCLPPLIA